MFRTEIEADYPVNPWAEAHAEAMQLGLPCPFDCYACERRAMRHEHRAACGHTVACDSEDCFYEDEETGRPWTGFRPLFACWDCYPAPREDVPCEAHQDPWAAAGIEPPF